MSEEKECMDYTCLYYFAYKRRHGKVPIIKKCPYKCPNASGKKKRGWRKKVGV